MPTIVPFDFRGTVDNDFLINQACMLAVARAAPGAKAVVRFQRQGDGVWWFARKTGPNPTVTAQVGIRSSLHLHPAHPAVWVEPESGGFTTTGGLSNSPHEEFHRSGGHGTSDFYTFEIDVDEWRAASQGRLFCRSSGRSNVQFTDAVGSKFSEEYELVGEVEFP